MGEEGGSALEDEQEWKLGRMTVKGGGGAGGPRNGCRRGCGTLSHGRIVALRSSLQNDLTAAS